MTASVGLLVLTTVEVPTTQSRGDVRDYPIQNDCLAGTT